jgi:hypothetical protein
MRSRATPAVPAMPMTEKSSAALTFSIEWEAMRLPIVALRSPAMRMPVAVRKQMIVVPSGVCPARSRTVRRRQGLRGQGAGEFDERVARRTQKRRRES